MPSDAGAVPIRAPARRGSAILMALVVGVPAVGSAQLISPGKLASPHSALEGMRNCTQCHALRQRGSANPKCLECHAPLAKRIADSTGLHATYGGRNCAACHKEHFGPTYRLVELDTATFEHGKTGYDLRLGHATVACGDCHTPEHIVSAEVRAFKGQHRALDRTFLGLPTACRSCHADDDPHERQFATRACDRCHDEAEWTAAPRFNHDRTRYRLTGEHRTARCAACHPDASKDPTAPRVQYVGLTFGACTACHKDHHRGAMGGTCTDCHTTAGWRRLNRNTFEGRFDHGATKFPLRGAHADVKCRTCHGRATARPKGIRMTFAAREAGATYPRPHFAACQSCHLDRHDGAFKASPGGITCDRCHGEVTWRPTTFGLAQHARVERFSLTGAHQAVPCIACHAGTGADSASATVFHLAKTDCASCHAERDPHAGQFAGVPCDRCHRTASFIVAQFDHSTTRYPLDGAHASVPCASCHRAAQATDGTVVVRYKPLGTACKDCHGGAS